MRGSQQPTAYARNNAVANKLEVGAGQKRLYAVWVYTTTAQSLHIFDAATVPIDTSVPTIPCPPLAVGWNYFEFGPGIPFYTGIAVSNSLNPMVQTIGAADCFFFILYS